jgi:hypothetical protein
LTKIAIFEAVGTISRSISIILPVNPGTPAARPVMLPPGRDRLWMPSLSGKGATHEYNRNAGSCRFQGYGCLWVGGDEYIGAESDQLGSESWQAILGLGVTILDDQVSPINPAMVSQAVEPRFLKGGCGSYIARKPSRRRAPCARERGGGTSSAAVAAMNSRRLIV